MAVRMGANSDLGLRVFFFSGCISPQDLQRIPAFYADRRLYRFGHAEIVYFHPTSEVSQLDVDDLSDLADAFADAVRLREDAHSFPSAWVATPRVLNDLRMWREFTSHPSFLRGERRIVETLEDACDLHGLDPSLASRIAKFDGLDEFDPVAAAA